MAMKERKLEIVEWKEKGKAVGGFLVSAERVKFDDGGTGMRYLVKREDGSIVAFRGAAQLDMRLNRSDLGAFIQIQYKGEDESREMSNGRNRPKLFMVGVDEERRIDVGARNPTPAAAAAGITDEDIPF